MFKLLLLTALVLFVVPFVSGFFTNGPAWLLSLPGYVSVYVFKVSSWGSQVKDFFKKLFSKYVQL